MPITLNIVYKYLHFCKIYVTLSVKFRFSGGFLHHKLDIFKDITLITIKILRFLPYFIK